MRASELAFRVAKAQAPTSAPTPAPSFAPPFVPPLAPIAEATSCTPGAVAASSLLSPLPASARLADGTDPVEGAAQWVLDEVVGEREAEDRWRAREASRPELSKSESEEFCAEQARARE